MVSRIEPTPQGPGPMKPRTRSNGLFAAYPHHTSGVERAIVALVVDGEACAAVVFCAQPTRRESPWGTVVIVERPRVDAAAGLRALLHLLHLLTTRASCRRGPRTTAVRRRAKNSGQTRGRMSRPDRYLPQELPTPERALPPRAAPSGGRTLQAWQTRCARNRAERHRGLATPARKCGRLRAHSR
jgi:hypothetical protein